MTPRITRKTYPALYRLLKSFDRAAAYENGGAVGRRQSYPSLGFDLDRLENEAATVTEPTDVYEVIAGYRNEPRYLVSFFDRIVSPDNR